MNGNPVGAAQQHDTDKYPLSHNRRHYQSVTQPQQVHLGYRLGKLDLKE